MSVCVCMYLHIFLSTHLCYRGKTRENQWSAQVHRRTTEDTGGGEGRVEGISEVGQDEKVSTRIQVLITLAFLVLCATFSRDSFGLCPQTFIYGWTFIFIALCDRTVNIFHIPNIDKLCVFITHVSEIGSFSFGFHHHRLASVGHADVSIRCFLLGLADW